MLLLIDNYDSFTWNLYQYFCQSGVEVCVRRNDEVTLAQIAGQRPDQLVISPGPCTPDDAGISLAAIAEFAGKIPILGVCLGHQAIAQAFGGRVVRAREVMHGKTSAIEHNDGGVFRGLNHPLTVTRYHSLIVEKTSFPLNSKSLPGPCAMAKWMRLWDFATGSFPCREYNFIRKAS